MPCSGRMVRRVRRPGHKAGRWGLAIVTVDRHRLRRHDGGPPSAAVHGLVEGRRTRRRTRLGSADRNCLYNRHFDFPNAGKSALCQVQADLPAAITGKATWMCQRLRLSQRDRDVFHTLTHRVRVLTVRQVARTWWPDAQDPPSAALQRLRQLEGVDLVECFSMLARPEIHLAGPVVSWRPEDGDPDFGAVAYRLKYRWTEPPQDTPMVIATARCAQRFAGYGGRRPRPAETTHDIHLAQIYLRLLQANDKRTRLWVSEAARARSAARRGRAAKLPDVLVGRPGKFLALEFGGEYDKARLREFHSYCQEHELPYEVW
jgi:hypothetical protein